MSNISNWKEFKDLVKSAEVKLGWSGNYIEAINEHGSCFKINLELYGPFSKRATVRGLEFIEGIGGDKFTGQSDEKAIDNLIENLKKYFSNKETIKLVRKIMKLKNGDGGSFDLLVPLDFADIYKKGPFIVSFKEFETIVNGKDFEEILEAISFKLFLLAFYSKSKIIGNLPDILEVWKDKNKIYLDLSGFFQTKEDAIKFGKDQKQLAIFEVLKDLNGNYVPNVLEL